MKDFTDFTKAVLRNSIYLLTSSVVAAFVTVYEHIRGSSLTAGLFSLVAVGLLVAALYKTWMEERERATKLDSEVLTLRKDLETEKSKKPLKEAQARLLDAQREEIETRKEARLTQEAHEERMRFLTAPDTGIRQFALDAITRAHSSAAFTVDILASGLNATKAEIEEALRILRAQGYAKETSLPGHWFIRA